MPPDPDRRFRRRLTIRHLVVLVAFAAVASAVVMPQARGAGNPMELLISSTIQVPYALLIPSMLLIRGGPMKSWLVAFLCSVPLASVDLYLLLHFRREIGTMIIRRDPVEIAGLAFLAAFASLPALGLAYLSRWTIPRACPHCRRRAMLRDPSVPGRDRFRWPDESRTCLACGSRFRRLRRGPWVDVDDLPAPPDPEAMVLGRRGWSDGRAGWGEKARTEAPPNPERDPR